MRARRTTTRATGVSFCLLSIRWQSRWKDGCARHGESAATGSGATRLAVGVSDRDGARPVLGRRPGTRSVSVVGAPRLSQREPRGSQRLSDPVAASPHGRKPERYAPTSAGHGWSATIDGWTVTGSRTTRVTRRPGEGTGYARS